MRQSFFLPGITESPPPTTANMVKDIKMDEQKEQHALSAEQPKKKKTRYR